MARSNSKTLASVYTHPAILTFGGILLAVTVAPAAFVASIVWFAFFVYFIFVVLDLALTKYHLWHFKPTTPQPSHYALITGGSHGIGLEMALQLAEKGYSLIIAARNQSTLDKAQAEILELHKSKSVDVITLSCDLSSSNGVQKLIDFVEEKQLVVDIFIHSAFVTLGKVVVDLSVEELDGLLALNLLAVGKLSHFFASQMVTRGVGRIMNIASVGASLTMPTAALYSSTKAFMLNFSQAMNYELRSTGVTVTCFCPGPVPTGFCNSLEFMCMSSALMVDAKTCAKNGLEGMFSAEGYLHDTYLSYVMGVIFRVVPARLRAFIGAVMMNKADEIIPLLKR